MRLGPIASCSSALSRCTGRILDTGHHVGWVEPGETQQVAAQVCWVSRRLDPTYGPMRKRGGRLVKGNKMIMVNKALMRWAAATACPCQVTHHGRA
jgi:hypothetical protein